MGMYMNATTKNKETGYIEPVESKFCKELGFDDVQVNTGFRMALHDFIDFHEGFITIKTKDMDKAITEVLKVGTVVYNGGYGGQYRGLSLEEKSMFIQMATICKVKGWDISGC